MSDETYDELSVHWKHIKKQAERIAQLERRLAALELAATVGREQGQVQISKIMLNDWVPATNLVEGAPAMETNG